MCSFSLKGTNCRLQINIWELSDVCCTNYGWSLFVVSEFGWLSLDTIHVAVDAFSLAVVLLKI